MAFNNYLEDENDKPYFKLNSLAYYYDKMEGFAKAVEGSAKALNLTKEEVEKRLTLYIEQNKNELDQRLAQWDGKLETFDSSVETLLTEWVNDGTLTHVIDSTLIDQKIEPVKALLADTSKYEASMIDLIKSHSGLKSDGVLVRRRVVNDIDVLDVAIFHEHEKASVYTMKKDDDGWWRLFDVVVRPMVKGNYKGDWNMSSNYDSDSGDLNKTSPPTYYATNVGSTFTGMFTGTGFYFNSRTDNRGGVWEFLIDGSITISISTWSSVSTSEVSTFVTDSLSNGTHTYVATFKGDDPLNTPLGGAGTSRGWVNFLTTTSTSYKKTITPIYEGYSQENGTIIKQATSRQEFAFSVKPSGASYESEWVPEHGVLGVMKDLNFKLFLGNREVLNVSSESTTYTPYSNVRFITSYKAYHPSDPNPLWEGRIDQTLNAQGFHTRGKMKFLRNTWVAVGYSGMLAMDKTSTDNDRVVTSKGHRYTLPKTTNDNSNVILNDTPSSIAHFTKESASQANKNIVTVIELFDIKRSLRLGQEGQAVNPTVVRLRADGQRKSYMQSHENYEAVTGEEHTFGSTVFVGEIYNSSEVLP